jgi:hypothetical protein
MHSTGIPTGRQWNGVAHLLSQAVVGRETKWGDFSNKQDKGVVLGGPDSC